MPKDPARQPPDEDTRRFLPPSSRLLKEPSNTYTRVIDNWIAVA
jgi:hypothetical protein